MQKYLPAWFQLKEIKSEIGNKIISSLAPKILTKKEDLDKIQPYLDKLKDTINAKGINNIALTGSYGSGKSTIIKTFKHYNRHNEYLNISLASFNNTEKKDGNIDENQKKLNREELERSLEVSILQQIFYHVKPSEIPESRFKRIINIPNWKLWTISIGFLLWILCMILLLKYKYLDKINPNNWKLKDDLDYFSIIIFLIVFFGVGYFSKSIIQLFSNSKINKVNIKGELELGENINKSVFNEHLEEILYFFEMTSYNVVIIEDLDRFDNTDIFTKLREINILLNNSKLIEREIKFVYAVGDDLFNDKKERVKFFEYIIPVIPFINSSNADEQLKTLIKETDLDDNIFSKEFLLDVTTFIDDIDMRLLTNIFHEFVIYRSTLKPEFIKKPEQLFAIVTYKNIDPEDFNKLNNKEGKLYDLINGKKDYIKKFVIKTDNEVDARNESIENIKNENISDIEELKSVYIKNVLLKLPKNVTIDLKNIIETFDEILNNEKIKYKQYNINYGQWYEHDLDFKFKDIENQVNTNSTYKERVELIKNKQNGKIDLLKKEIEKLRIKKAEIESWDLKQIFKEIDINEYLKDFSNNALLRNLILEGYINENYNDYISLFHEVSLTKEDKNFERNVKSGFNTEFTYNLTNIENLVDNHIELKYFGRETILNFNLLDHLGANYPKYSTKYDAIIKLLSNDKQRSIDFIHGYVVVDKIQLRLFIEKLVKNWTGFWDYIYFKSSYTKESEDYYLSLIIKYAKIEDVIFSQNENTLTKAIMEKPDFLSIVKNTDELNFFAKITNLIEKLNIKFEKLENPNDETKELFEFVFNNNHYQINKDNLLQMIKVYGQNEDYFETKNYSTIQNSNCIPLIEYIRANINIYVEDVYLKLEQNISDSEDSLLELLNNAELDDNLKIKIIQKVETIITDLNTIDDAEVKKQLLINNKVIPKWDNIINYYNDCENKIDEYLVSFLNLENVYAKLSEDNIPKKTEQFNNETFEIELLKNNNISDESYIKLTDSCNHKWKNLNFKELSQYKVIHLIYKRLGTTKENYDLLKENFQNNHIKLIENDFTKFIENIDDFETDENDILLLLKSNKIGVNNGFKYISKINEQTIINNKEIGKEVGDIIVNKAEIVEFEFSTLKSLITHCDTNKNKVKLINLYFNTLSNDDITTLVKIIGWDYKELFVKQHQPKFEDNIYHRELLSKLKSKKLINSFDTYKKDNTKIKAVANY
jgi:hypothetical protein